MLGLSYEHLDFLTIDGTILFGLVLYIIVSGYETIMYEKQEGSCRLAKIDALYFALMTAAICSHLNRASKIYSI